MTDSNDHDDQRTETHRGDVAFIQALAELLESNQLAELSVDREYGDDDRLSVSLSKYSSAPQAAAPAPVAAAPAFPAPTAAPTALAPELPEDPTLLPGAVTSPMVGTAYLAAEPGAAPFVQVGQAVSEGETLMIVEAMKTMNHISAPNSGVVRRILVEDGTPVEFGAPLMIVE